MVQVSKYAGEAWITDIPVVIILPMHKPAQILADTIYSIFKTDDRQHLPQCITFVLDPS